jgi:hypothetical protein
MARKKNIFLMQGFLPSKNRLISETNKKVMNNLARAAV